MARIYKDRVGETTAAPGLGNFTLGGALPGYQAFAGAVGVGDTFDYSAFAVDGNGVPNGGWETGTGTFVAGDAISRVVQESSNTNNLVNFAAGTTVVVLMSENAASIAALAAGGGGGGGGGSSKPWYWAPPAASSLTPFTADATAPLVTEDADLGTVIDMGRCNGGRRGVMIPVRTDGNWIVDVHWKYTGPASNYSAPELGPLGWNGSSNSRGRFLWYFTNNSRPSLCRWIEQLDGGGTNNGGEICNSLDMGDLWTRWRRWGPTDYEAFWSRDGKNWFSLWRQNSDDFNGVVPNMFYAGLRVDGGDVDDNSHCVMVIDHLAYSIAA